MTTYEDPGVRVGDRIKLVSTKDEHTRLRPGDLGTVTDIRVVRGPFGGLNVSVTWDSGSRLSLLPFEGDEFEVVQKGDGWS